jgi:RNA polymerase sigma-70 factor (ECF subfamily)
VSLDGVAEAVAVPEDDSHRMLDTRRMLGALDERQRLIVEQISLEGRSAAEVGTQLGMSEGAVRVALHRALKKLAHVFRRSRDED